MFIDGGCNEERFCYHNKNLPDIVKSYYLIDNWRFRGSQLECGCADEYNDGCVNFGKLFTIVDIYDIKCKIIDKLNTLYTFKHEISSVQSSYSLIKITFR